MATRKQLETEATKHEAEIEFTPYDSETDIEIVAPDDMQWVSGQCIHMVARCWSYIKGSRAEAYDDLIERMKNGLEPLDTEINP